jgi:hypothetical protein
MSWLSIVQIRKQFKINYIMRPSKEKIRTELTPEGVHNLEMQCALDWIKLRNLEAEKAEKAKEFSDKITPLKKQLDRNSAATTSGVLEETRECFIQVNHDTEKVEIFADEEGTEKIGERYTTEQELNEPLDMDFNGEGNTPPETAKEKKARLKAEKLLQEQD